VISYLLWWGDGESAVIHGEFLPRVGEHVIPPESTDVHVVAGVVYLFQSMGPNEYQSTISVRLEKGATDASGDPQASAE
jgi:hypothetical protein